MGSSDRALSWPARLLRTLPPSFVADMMWPDQRPGWRLHATSYLDGLRGIASFVVFFCHYTEENHKYMVPSYGLNPDGQASSFLQLPFFRIAFSGRPMVHVFFVISGFVLSHKPLRALHDGGPRALERCAAALSSSAFRRPLRLFGPCAAETLMIAACCQLGWLYEPLPALSTQLWIWKDVMFHSVTWPWAWDADLRPGYDVHLWTIPIEFAHSMLLFLVILLLARVKLKVRQASTAGLMAYCLCCGKWAAFEFLGGMWLAEMRIVQSLGRACCGGGTDEHRGIGQKEQLPQPHARRGRRLLRSIFWIGVVAAFVFVGGWPNSGADRTRGIRALLAATPDPFAHGMDDLAPQKFWFALAALSAVWACGELAWARRLLDSGPAQYCGRLSFAIYIVHGPVLAMLQLAVVGEPFSPERVVPADGDGQQQQQQQQVVVPAVPGWGVKGMFGVDGPTQRFLAWLGGLVILLPVTVWVADVFWRLVDVPVIAAARWVETVCLDDGPDEDAGRKECHCQLTSIAAC
ncbi:hypothetical protein RB598_006663 [Gaeumannomyces tritici]